MKKKYLVLLSLLFINKTYSQSLEGLDQVLVFDNIAISQEKDVLPLLLEGDKYLKRVEDFYAQGTKKLLSLGDQYFKERLKLKELKSQKKSEDLSFQVKKQREIIAKVKDTLESYDVDAEKLNPKFWKESIKGHVAGTLSQSFHMDSQNKLPKPWQLANHTIETRLGTPKKSYDYPFSAKYHQNFKPVFSKHVAPFMSKNKVAFLTNDANYQPLIYQAKPDKEGNETKCLIKFQLNKNFLNLSIVEAKDPLKGDYKEDPSKAYTFDKIKETRRCISLMAKEIQREVDIEKKGGPKVTDIKFQALKIKSSVPNISDVHHLRSQARVERKGVPPIAGIPKVDESEKSPAKLANTQAS